MNAASLEMSDEPYILPAISFRRRGFEIPGFVKKYSNFEPK